MFKSAWNWLQDSLPPLTLESTPVTLLPQVEILFRFFLAKSSLHHVTLSAGGFDYVPVNVIIRKSQFTLSSDSVMGCIDVEVVDDQLSEMEEGFVIEVVNGSLILTQITVNIESSDGR